jgi:hypothetical protein
MKRALVIAAGAGVCMFGVALASEPTFFARRDYSTEWGQIIVTDVNADKFPDVISFNGGYAAVMFGNGDGTLRQGPSSNLGVYGPEWRPQDRPRGRRTTGQVQHLGRRRFAGQWRRHIPTRGLLPGGGEQLPRLRCLRRLQQRRHLGHRYGRGRRHLAVHRSGRRRL